MVACRGVVGVFLGVDVPGVPARLVCTAAGTGTSGAGTSRRLPLRDVDDGRGAACSSMVRDFRLGPSAADAAGDATPSEGRDALVEAVRKGFVSSGGVDVEPPTRATFSALLVGLLSVRAAGLVELPRGRVAPSGAA